MKLIIMLWGLLLHIGFLCACPFDNGLFAAAYSHELPTITGTCTVSFTISAYRNGVTLQNTTIENLPENWQMLLSNASVSTLDSGESAVITASITYPVSNLPFYPESISFYLYSQQTNSGVIDSMEVEAKIYFTPYNTVEIWDIAEFAGLNRFWLPRQNPEPPRIYINRDSIPISDIPVGFAAIESWQNNFESLFIEGLAYHIPMEAIYEDTTDTGSSANKDGCGNGEQRYIFTVKGRLIADYKRNGLTIQIPLKGLKVEVREWDLGQDEVLASMATNENGEFEIVDINTCQSTFWEGDKLEVYLRIYAENSFYDIRGIAQFQNHTFCEESQFNLIVDYNNGNAQINPVDFGDLKLEDETFRAVHFAVLQYDFVNIQYQQVGSAYTLPHGLELRTHRSGTSHFSPIPTNTIYYKTHNAGHETTPFHEFGHFLMWHLQGGLWGNPINCSFLDHSFQEEMSPCGAWTEGWADGVAFICDAYYAEKDSEWVEWAVYSIENIDSTSAKIQNIQNGFNAEYFVGAMLYDLWDGPSNFAHIQDQSILSQMSFNDKIGAIYDWAQDDNLSYHFTQIADALRPYGALGLNIINTGVREFYHHFTEDMDCEEKVNVKRAFNENLIRDNINDMRTSVSSDEIKYTFTNINIEILNANLYNFYEEEYNYLTDNTDITNNANLHINANLPIGYNNFNPHPLPNNTPYEAYSCGNSVIYIYNGGTLNIGDFSQPNDYAANFTIKSGCTLKLGQSGILKINNNSKIIIEQGATLIIEQGASIELLGNNAILEIQGNLDLKDNAIFTFTGTGFVRFANGNTITAGNNAEMKFVGSSLNDKVVEITDNSNIANYSLVKTTVQNGKCELGQNAFWDTGDGAVLFENAIFTALNTDKPYQTIYTNGQAPVIHDCEFSYGETGLTARNFMSLGAALGLENVEIHHCNIGLRDYDKGAFLTNVHFHDNTIGWKADYQAFNSVLLNPEIDNNTDAGVSYTGNSNLNAENPYIHDNMYGLDYIGSGNLIVNCGSVSFNGSTGIGGYNHAKIDLADAAKVNISHNGTSSVFLWGANAYLNHGKNNLVPEPTGIALAVLSSYIGNSLLANENHWNNLILPNGTSPTWITDYELYKVSSGNVVPLNVFDYQPIEYQSCDGIIKRQIYIPECSECESITTTHFNNIRLDNALRQVAEDMYAYSRFQHITTNYDLLSEIMDYHYMNTTPFQDEILNIAWEMTKNIFAEGIATSNISYNLTGEMGQAASKVFQILDNRIAETIDTPTIFYLNMDKAILYNMLQRPATALNLLNAITATSSEENEYKDYWNCFVELRKDMQIQAISSVEMMQRLENCPAITRQSAINANKTAFQAKEPSIMLSPNPSHSEAQLTIFSPKSVEATLIVYDIQGRKVQEIPSFYCNKGTTTISLSAQSLANGVYSVVIHTEKEVLSTKWVVGK